MRTFWSFSILFRVMPGGHEHFEVGDEQCAQVLVPHHTLLDALPQLRQFLKQENLDLLDIQACCRFDLDRETEIADYVRSDGEAILDSSSPTISVYIVAKDAVN